MPGVISRTRHFVFSSRRRHTRFDCDWSSAVCSSDLILDDDTMVVPKGFGATLVATNLSFPSAIEFASDEIGRASCREREYILADAQAVKEKRQTGREQQDKRRSVHDPSRDA